MSEYLTTTELAELLRIKKRKVYDLAASGEIPCSRAMGKLLFPTEAVRAWIAASGSGIGRMAVAPNRPNVLLGSHDPLLDWAIRESRCGLATQFDSSLDGLQRFANHEGIATGTHLFDTASDDWNVPAVKDRFGNAAVVLVEWCWRERGLIVAPDKARDINSLGELAGYRVVPRQPESGTQILLEHLLTAGNVRATFIHPARSEADAVLAVLDGKADATFGLETLASQYRLAFVPLVRERFDLLVDRHAWFEASWQTFFGFCQSAAFREKAAEFSGYDAAGLGRVHFNGP